MAGYRYNQSDESATPTLPWRLCRMYFTVSDYRVVYLERRSIKIFATLDIHLVLNVIGCTVLLRHERHCYLVFIDLSRNYV